MEQKPFDEITVDELVRHARSSKGCFYARFRDKESLFRLIVQEYSRGVRRTSDELLAPEHWRNSSIEDMAAGISVATIQHHRSRTGLFRTLVQRSVTSSEFQRLEETQNRHVARLIAKILEPWVPANRRARLEKDVQFGFVAVLGVLLEQVLYPDSLELTDEELAEHLTQLFLGAVGRPTVQ